METIILLWQHGIEKSILLSQGLDYAYNKERNLNSYIHTLITVRFKTCPLRYACSVSVYYSKFLQSAVDLYVLGSFFFVSIVFFSICHFYEHDCQFIVCFL